MSALRFSTWPRSRTFVVGFYIVVAAVAYEAAKLVLDEDFTALSYAVMFFVGSAFVVGILNNWQNGVYFFLSWLLFEDFARKFLGNNMAIFFAKDFLLLIVLTSFIRARRHGKVATFKPPFFFALMLFVWFGLLQVFNPASTSIWYGLLGAKMFFGYVPLLLIGYSLINSEAELRRFFTLTLVLAVFILSLGIAQSILGPSFLNPAQPAEDLRELSTLYRVAPITGAVAYRPTSVFVSTGRYGNFIEVVWPLMLGYSGYLLLRHKQGRALAFIAVAVTAAAALLSTSRGVFMWSMIYALAASVGFLWGAPWRVREVRNVFRTILRVAIGIALSVALLFTAFPDALLSRLAVYKETLLPGSAASELAFRSWDYPLKNFLGAFDYDRWLYGYGIGTTGLGGQYVARFFHVRPPVVGVESGFGTLVVEMGIGGLILWLIMSGAILLCSWRVVKNLKGSPLFPVAFVIFLFAFFLLIPATVGGMQPYEDFLLNAYFWLLLGLLFRLPDLSPSSGSNAKAAEPLPH